MADRTADLSEYETYVKTVPNFMAGTPGGVTYEQLTPEASPGASPYGSEMLTQRRPNMELSYHYTIGQRRFLLILFELIEHVDFGSDFFFLIRVFMAENKTMMLVAPVCVFISLAGYMLKFKLFKHTLSGEELEGIRLPVVVFWNLINAPDDVIFEAECVTNSYSLAMRVIEDIPQVALSSAFMFENGITFIPLFSGTLSVLLLFITTYRTVMVWHMSLWKLLISYLYAKPGREEDPEMVYYQLARPEPERFFGFFIAATCSYAISHAIGVFIFEPTFGSVFTLLCFWVAPMLVAWKTYWVAYDPAAQAEATVLEDFSFASTRHRMQSEDRAKIRTSSQDLPSKWTLEEALERNPQKFTLDNDDEDESPARRYWAG